MLIKGIISLPFVYYTKQKEKTSQYFPKKHYTIRF